MVSSIDYTMALLFVLALMAVFKCSHEFDESFYKHVYPAVEDASPGTESIYIALISSFGDLFVSSGAVSGVQVALDQINSDSSILPGYTLHYTLTDSKCNRTVALDSFFTEIIQEPTKIAVIGSGCSVATEPTAEVSYYYNITQLSCTSSSEALTDRSKFRSYFQMLGRQGDLAIAFYGTIKKFEWKRIAIFMQNENLFTVTMNRLKEMLIRANVTVDEQIFETNGERLTGREGGNIFTQFSDPEPRIFILAMYPSEAVYYLCEAYKQDVHYPHHQFLVLGWFPPKWWVGSNDTDYGCSVAERESVLEYAIGPYYPQFYPDVNDTSDSGYTTEEFLKVYREYLNESMSQFNMSLRETVYGQSCYESVWTLAYALNNTITEFTNNPDLNSRLVNAYDVQNSSSAFHLSDFTYGSDELKNVIFKHLKQTNRTGITGPIQFDPFGTSRLFESLILYQHRYITASDDSGTGERALQWPTRLATVTTETKEFVFKDGQDKLVWKTVNGELLVPYDGVPMQVTLHPNIGLVIVVYILSAAGVVISVFCIGFTFIFRKRKLIRLSSPNLNYLIACGAIVLYTNSSLFVIPSTNNTVISVTCNITLWLGAIGYSLCFGTILAKMGRVYYIFESPTLRKQTIKDWMLATVVLLLVVIDVVILLIYTIIEATRGNLGAKHVANRENPMELVGELDMLKEYFIHTCDSTNRDIVLGIIYGFKGVLQILALILSFCTRKVKVKGLDDSKYIAAAVYVTSIVLAVIIVATYTLKDFANVLPALLFAGYFTGTTAVLCLVFVPKMVSLYRDPDGESVFSKAEITHNIESSIKKPGVNAQGSFQIDENVLNFSSKDSIAHSELIETLRAEIVLLKNELQAQQTSSNGKAEQPQEGD